MDYESLLGDVEGVEFNPDLFFQHMSKPENQAQVAKNVAQAAQLGKTVMNVLYPETALLDQVMKPPPPIAPPPMQSAVPSKRPPIRLPRKEPSFFDKNQAAVIGLGAISAIGLGALGYLISQKVM